MCINCPDKNCQCKCINKKKTGTTADANTLNAIAQIQKKFHKEQIPVSMPEYYFCDVCQHQMLIYFMRKKNATETALEKYAEPKKKPSQSCESIFPVICA